MCVEVTPQTKKGKSRKRKLEEEIPETKVNTKKQKKGKKCKRRHRDEDVEEKVTGKQVNKFKRLFLCHESVGCLKE